MSAFLVKTRDIGFWTRTLRVLTFFAFLAQLSLSGKNPLNEAESVSTSTSKNCWPEADLGLTCRKTLEKFLLPYLNFVHPHIYIYTITDAIGQTASILQPIISQYKHRGRSSLSRLTDFWLIGRLTCSPKTCIRVFYFWGCMVNFSLEIFVFHLKNTWQGNRSSIELRMGKQFKEEISCYTPLLSPIPWMICSCSFYSCLLFMFCVVIVDIQCYSFPLFSFFSASALLVLRAFVYCSLSTISTHTVHAGGFAHWMFHCMHVLCPLSYSCFLYW